MHRFFLSATLLLGLGLFALAPASAHDAGIQAALQRAVERPPDPQAVLAVARGRLSACIEGLDQLLAKSSPDEARQWRQWLDVPAIRAELSAPQANAAALRKIQQRYFQNQHGLELPAMVAVRQSLDDFLTAKDFAAAPSPRELHRQQLAELTECLAALEADPTAANTHRAGALVAWFAPLGEDGAALARAVRSRYCRPNGTGQVSQRFINLMLAQTVEEQRFVSELILGSQTTGLARTQGQVSFGTVLDSQRGTLEVRLEGQTACPANVAQRGRILVYSSASTSIRASKQVHISDLGLSLTPATAACLTSVQINDVEASSRLLERLSFRRANQLVPQAEQAAARRAESEASGKLDQQADAALGRMNDVFCQQIRAPLIRKGALPAQLRFWTDLEHLRLSLAQHNSAQLGAATSPPELPVDCDLGGCAHESLVNNFCETLLKGVTIEDQAWRELMNLLTGSSPRPLWVHDRTERWSVTMARQQPVVVRFARDQVSIAFHLAGVARVNRKHDQAVEIEARFIPQITLDGPAFTRAGGVEIRIAGEATQGDEELRTFLAKKFGAVLPPALELSGLVPPAGGSLGKLRQLKLTQFSSDGGWLQISYRLPSNQIASQSHRERR